MKKIHTILFAGLLFSSLSHAQTLTKNLNEPAPGDLHTTTVYDTSTALPRNTGINQLWNFSTVTTTNTPVTTTFAAASSVPFSSVFPGATLAEDEGGGSYSFFKSASTPTTQFEALGYGTNSGPQISITFTNPMINYIWPIAYGNSFSDSFSGKATGLVAGTYNGNATVTATGTGTIVMPGGTSYSNILQVKTVRNVVFSMTSPIAVSYSTSETQYDYFEPSQRFPLLTVNIALGDDGMAADTSISVEANKIITVGITDRNFDADYAIYPNPAKDYFNVKLTNSAGLEGKIEIFSATGQFIKTTDLGKDEIIETTVPISDLDPGIYFVKTSLGQKASSRRLVVE